VPSALELYYRNRSQNKPVSAPVKDLAAKELLGVELPKKNIGFFHKLLDILDRPGNATRALLVGKLGGLKGLIPFAQSIENLTGLDIALNKEELVTGIEVIEKFFGKQKQRKGKIDPVDVLGFMVEVVADPIWLTGIGGLTKTGKAARLVQSVWKGAKGSPEALKFLQGMVRSAKAGKAVTDRGKLAKSFQLVYGKGFRPTLAKTWAEQAATGQRALLKFAGKPLIKGEKALAGIERAGTALKMGKVGKVFLAPTRRVPTKYKELHDLATHFGRDLPFVKQQEYFKKIKELFEGGAKAGRSAEDMDKLVRSYIQRAYAGEGGERFAKMFVAKRGPRVAREVKKLEAKAKVINRRIATLTKQAEKVKTKAAKSKVAGAKGELNKQLQRIQKNIDYWENVYGKGLKRTAEGRVPVAKLQKVQAAVEKRGIEAKEMLAAMPPKQAEAVGKLAPEYHKITRELTRREIKAGAPAKRIMYPIGYTPRNITPEFRAWMESHKHRSIVANFARDLSARNAAQRMRNKIIGGMTDTEALTYFRKLGYTGKAVFEPSMAGATLVRAMKSTRSIGAADTINEAVKKFGRPDIDFWRAKGYSSAGDVFQHTGVIPKELAYAKRLLPNEVKTALLEVHNLATSDEALRGFWAGWTGVQRYYKGAFTMPWPAYHTRNMFSNFVLNWIGGVKNPRSYMKALALQMNRGVPLRLPNGLVLSPDDLMRHAREWGILGKSVGFMEPEEIGKATIKGTKGLFARHFKGQGIIRQKGMAAGIAIEDNARLAHFIEKLESGFNFQDAARSAKNVLFDYGDLSRIEKKYFRDRGIFFYTFARKNIALQAKTLLQQPGKQAFWSHVAGGTPEMLGPEREYPDWWREQIVSRPLAIPFIKPKEGEEVRIAGMGMPFEEAFGSFAGPGYSVWERARRIAARQFGKVAPMIRTPAEFITGRDIFYDKPISETGYAPYFLGGATKLPYVGKAIERVAGVKEIAREGKPSYYKMRPELAWGIRQTPAARAWSSAAMISKRGQPWPIKASHFMLGQKPRFYNPDLQREWAEKRATRRLLEEKYRAGDIRKFQRFYVPKGREKDEQMELLLKSQ